MAVDEAFGVADIDHRPGRSFDLQFKISGDDFAEIENDAGVVYAVESAIGQVINRTTGQGITAALHEIFLMRERGEFERRYRLRQGGGKVVAAHAVVEGKGFAEAMDALGPQRRLNGEFDVALG